MYTRNACTDEANISNNNKGVSMTTINFSMSVLDERSSKHKITAIGKGKGVYDLALTLDNGKVITFDERLVFTEQYICAEDMYVVVVTKE